MTNEVHISKMTGKLEGFRAISTNTTTNPYCIKQNASGRADNICTHCYSHTMLNTYRKNMQASLQRNSDLLSRKTLEDWQVPRVLDAFFRFDAHGELIIENHLHNLVLIAEANPHCTFALWSKRVDLVRKYFKQYLKPTNLILIYSNSRIGKVLAQPPHPFDKTFNNVPEDQDVELQNCTGQKCKDCLLCYRMDTTDTIVEKVKRY